MTSTVPKIELSRTETVSIHTLEKSADACAAELWGRAIRGAPLPLSDAGGVFAWVYPYALTGDEFPVCGELLRAIRAIRERSMSGKPGESGPAAYFEQLGEFCRRFGSVCVSATQPGAPILSVSHSLASSFILLEAAEREAARQAAGEVTLSGFHYFSPQEQFVEFKSDSQVFVVDAIAPGRSIPAGALTRRSPLRGDVEIERGMPGSTQPSPRMALEADVPIAAIREPGSAAAPVTKKIANWELIPKVDHTPKNWCVPTSWAMLLGFYDNYADPKGTFLGYGRLIDYWYELTPGGFNLPNLIDDLISTQGASVLNNYTFPEKKANNNKTDQWNMLTSEIDAGRPCFFTMPGHCTTAFGYKVDSAGQKFAIVYDPPNPSTPTYVAEHNLQLCDGVGAVQIGGGTPGHNLVIIEPDGGESFYTSAPNEIIWFSWGDGIKKTRISVSQDGGNNWQQVAAGVATKGAWNGYAWIPAATGTRIRVKVEGLTESDALVAADGSFKNLAIKDPFTGNAWIKIWGPTSDVLVSSVPGKSGVLIFAAPASGDGIYRYDGGPMAWTKVGGPGKQFALDNAGNLYGLSPDGANVFRYDGVPMEWTRIGGAAGAIYAGGNCLFASNPQTGDIWQYNGAPLAWTKIGGPGKEFAVDLKGRLYGISPDGSGLYRYGGVPLQWTRIGNQTTAIYAGGCGLYATGGAANDVNYFSLTPHGWTNVGGPGKMFAVDDIGRLYGLSPDGSAVLRYSGTWLTPRQWTKIGGAAGKIFAGGNGRVFATNPQTNDLMSFE